MRSLKRQSIEGAIADLLVLVVRALVELCFCFLIPIQNEDEHNLEAESLAVKGFNLNYSVQLHIHLVLDH